MQTTEDLPLPHNPVAPSYREIIHKMKYEQNFLKKIEYTFSQFYEEEQLFWSECENLVTTSIISYYRAPLDHRYQKVIVRIIYKK